MLAGGQQNPQLSQLALQVLVQLGSTIVQNDLPGQKPSTLPGNSQPGVLLPRGPLSSLSTLPAFRLQIEKGNVTDSYRPRCPF